MSKQHVFHGKEDLIDSYWMEFLMYIKDHNDLTKHAWGKDATEINFWHWYIENKLP